MKEAAEVNKQRNDMHMEKRTRDKTIRDALVRGEGRGRGGGGEGRGSCCLYLDLTWHSNERTYSWKEMLCSSFLSEAHNHLFTECAERVEERDC